ncbi:YueI family protein [Streptococcus ratti]|uniref:YueI family protein n=1 Tax=Streptococcus ratti TaxID=1341 RepID=A0A7X9QFV0_STRRT|nr:YueI family protein [Streptococcus ratti]NMD49421.1 YueI family protein [Streptococcus ratti]
MTDLEKKVLESAQGERRLNPDEQRKYLGTFAERLVLSILLTDAEKPAVFKALDAILADLKANYNECCLKISSKLSLNSQMVYMKKAQEASLPATIVDEDNCQSPFGLLIHTNKAEHLENTDIKALYPKLFAQQDEQPQQKSFWKKWFGKK